MKKRTKKKQHGGQRPGAGRKAERRSKSGKAFVTVSVVLPEDVIDVLDQAVTEDHSRSQEILSLLCGSSPKIRRLITK